MALLNRFLGVLLGLAIAAAGVVLIVETVVAALGRPPVVIDRQLVDSTLSAMRWIDPFVLWLSIGLIAAGALLLLLQLIPRRPATLSLRAHEDRTAVVDRKALGARLADAAGRDSDVVAAKAKLTRRVAKIAVRSVPGADVGGVRARVHDAVVATLENYELAANPKVKVSVASTRARNT